MEFAQPSPECDLLVGRHALVAGDDDTTLGE
jgi:hypothetical protein